MTTKNIPGNGITPLLDIKPDVTNASHPHSIPCQNRVRLRNASKKAGAIHAAGAKSHLGERRARLTTVNNHRPTSRILMLGFIVDFLFEKRMKTDVGRPKSESRTNETESRTDFRMEEIAGGTQLVSSLFYF